jgi:hypothetical protein
MLNLLGKCPNRNDVRVKTVSGAAPDFCCGWAWVGPPCVWVGTAVLHKSVYVYHISTNCEKNILMKLECGQSDKIFASLCLSW